MTRPDLVARAREQLRSGAYLPRRARADAMRPLVVADRHRGADLELLVDTLMDIQLRHPYIKPIVLVAGGTDTSALRRSGLLYESLLTPDDLDSLGTGTSWVDYRRGRVTTAVELYDPQVVVELAPSEQPTADLLLVTDSEPD